MRIFLTGATGYVGRAVLDALIRGGHEVTALVRNNEKAARVTARGAQTVVGNMGEPDSYRTAAEAQDGYIHTALDNSAARAADIDKVVIDTLIAAGKRPRTAGAGVPPTRFFIYTSNVWVLGRAPEPADERTPAKPIAYSQWRAEHESLVLAAATPQLRTIVVRPGVVYGGGQGIVGDLFKSAANGLVRVVGDGNNRWPLVYDRDLADFFLRLASSEDASGIYHANDEADERVNDIVGAISPHLPLRPDVRHVPIEEASKKMGTYAEVLSLDQVVRSPRARALGWSPSLSSVSNNAARLLEEWRNNK
jgi:nucleoside-diphosphate-sugar epimerase